MKYILILLFSILTINTFGQKINEGSGMFFENRYLNNLFVDNKVDPNIILKKLQDKIGNGDIRKNEKLGQEICWTNVKFDNLDDTLILRIARIPTSKYPKFVISCTDLKGNDLLIPKSQSQKRIKEYVKLLYKD